LKNHSNNDKARVRVFFGEIEGDNGTVKDALRSIAEAVKQTFQQEPRTIKVIATGGNIDQKQLAAASEVMETEIAAELEDEEIEVSSNGTTAKPRAPRTKKAITYSLVKELNLRPPDKQHLRDFFSEKKPGSQRQQITVIVYYLQRIIEVQSIGANHVFTGMKEVGMRIPPDISQVMRSIASDKGWLNTANKDDVKMAVAGDNFVEHDLPPETAAVAAE